MERKAFATRSWNFPMIVASQVTAAGFSFLDNVVGKDYFKLVSTS